MIEAAVKKYMPYYDSRLYKAQLRQESNLKANAVSPAGAVGIAQFMPLTWLEWSERSGYKGVDRTNAEASVFTGAMYMDNLIKKWSSPRPDIDRWCLAMASYNAGFGNILKAQKLSGGKVLFSEVMPHLVKVTGASSEETLVYVPRILDYYNKEVIRYEY